MLVAIIVLMYALASRTMVRSARPSGCAGTRHPRTCRSDPVSAEELAALVDSRRPDVIGLVGIIGLLILLWLMMFKPF